MVLFKPTYVGFSVAVWVAIIELSILWVTKYI